MKRKTKIQENLIDILFYIVGGMLFSLAINMFTSPNNITVGGFSGIATILNYLFRLPIGSTVFILNIPLFILAFHRFGFRFIFKTLLATGITSVLLDLGVLYLPVYQGDRLLCSIFGGAFLGAGLGVVFLRGSTTGGTDIIAKLVLRTRPQISMGRVILLVDLFVIILSAVVYKNLESALYSAVAIFVSSKSIDFVTTGLDTSKSAFVVTDKGEEITDKILTELERGVSIIPAHGGYSKDEKQILFCALRSNELARFSKLVKSIDNNSFTVITDAGSIYGNGFYKEI